MKASSQRTGSSAGKKNFRASGIRLGLLLAWVALGLLLVLGLPLFLCMGVSSDVACYGLSAQKIVHGRVPEWDLMIPLRSPAMGLPLAVVQSLCGWSIKAVHLLDVIMVGGVIGLLTRWLRLEGASRVTQVWAAFALVAFYFATGEWCQCQPDLWVLVPVLGALLLRVRQVTYLFRHRSPTTILRGALLEGLCWGTACLLKPFVAVSWLLCWLLAVVAVKRKFSRSPGLLATDALGLLCGGLAIGGLWTAWLWWGGWPLFWDGISLEGGWNWPARFWLLIESFWPWGLVQLVAVPLAGAAVLDVLTGRSRQATAEGRARSLAQGLLGGFYLSYFVQANFFESQYDYQLAPCLFLALAVVAGQPGRLLRLARRRWLVVRSALGRLAVPAPLAWVMLLALAAYVGASHPLIDASRLSLWPRCWSADNSAAMRDLLMLNSEQHHPEYWADLERIAHYLRGQQLGPRDLTCYGRDTAFLYLELNLPPPTSASSPSPEASRCSGRHDWFCRVRHARGRRFVVSDLRELGLNDPNFWVVAARRPRRPRHRYQYLATLSGFPPEAAQSFPWSEPVVFGSGPYLVHRMTALEKKRKGQRHQPHRIESTE